MQRISIHNKYQQTADISNQIASEPDNFILGTSIDDLVNYYYSNNHFTPIEIDPERTDFIEIKKERKIVPANQREGPFQSSGDLPFDFESIILKIPIKPHPQLDIIKNLETSSYSTGFSLSDVIWGNDVISLIIAIKGYGYNKNDDQVKQEVHNSKPWLTTH